MNKKSCYFLCCITVFLLLAFLPGTWAAETKHIISDSDLQKINDLVLNLKEQNDTLSAQLKDSQTNMEELNGQLNEMKNQIADLKQMLDQSNQEIITLKGEADTSEKESQKLLITLQQAKDSLADLEKAVTATKKQLNTVVIQRNVSIAVAIIVLITRFF